MIVRQRGNLVNQPALFQVEIADGDCLDRGQVAQLVLLDDTPLDSKLDRAGDRGGDIDDARADRRPFSARLQTVNVLDVNGWHPAGQTPQHFYGILAAKCDPRDIKLKGKRLRIRVESENIESVDAIDDVPKFLVVVVVAKRYPSSARSLPAEL